MDVGLKEKIVGIFNADYGAKYGFGIDEYFRFKHLSKQGYVKKLIYRDYKKDIFSFDSSLISKALPFGNFIPKVFSAIEIYSREKFKINYFTKSLFDNFAKTKIPKINNGYLFTYPDYLKSIKKAKNLEYTIVLFTGCHPEWIYETAEQEYKKYEMQLHSSYEKKIFTRQIESLKNADFIVALTEFNKKTLIDKGISESKIFVNHNGINFEIKNYVERKNEKIRFLFLSNITLMKGLEYLLIAWENLRLENAELIICGHCSTEFQKHLNSHLSNPTIKYEGYSKNPKKYFESCSIFILPSLIEGMSRGVIEAMAHGMPVIVTPVSAPYIKNYVDGIIIPPRNVKEIEKALLFFYQNQEKIKEMGENAIKTAKNLTWENHSKRMVKIFETIALQNK